MRWIVPFALLGAALVALLTTPESRPLLGLSHGAFAGGALSLSLLTALLSGVVVRVGAFGVARVFASLAIWTAIGAVLVGVYSYRDAFSEFGARIYGELDPTAAEIGPGGVVTVRRHGDEFLVPGKVNGRSVSFVFDTGASSVVLTAEDAEAAGLRFADGDFQVSVMTANGEAQAAPVRLDRMAVGPIVARGVRALVARPGVMTRSLLGMTFLERLKSYGVEGGKLVLKGA